MGAPEKDDRGNIESEATRQRGRWNYEHQESWSTRLWVDGLGHRASRGHRGLRRRGARAGAEVSRQGFCRNREVVDAPGGARSGQGRHHRGTEDGSAVAAEGHDQHARPRRLRHRHRGHHRERRREAQDLRAARRDREEGRDLRHQYFFHLRDRVDDGHQAAGALHRPALLQSGADDEAGGSGEDHRHCARGVRRRRSSSARSWARFRCAPATRPASS